MRTLRIIALTVGVTIAVGACASGEPTATAERIDTSTAQGDWIASGSCPALKSGYSIQITEARSGNIADGVLPDDAVGLEIATNNPLIEILDDGYYDVPMFVVGEPEGTDSILFTFRPLGAPNTASDSIVSVARRGGVWIGDCRKSYNLEKSYPVQLSRSN